jgi:hypothetical protein
MSIANQINGAKSFGLRATVMELVRAAKLRDDFSVAPFRHGGFTEAADADLTDAQLRAAGRKDGRVRPWP